MKPTLFQFVVFVYLFINKIECVTHCEAKYYYSEDLPGCVRCPTAKCKDQHFPDIARCKDACETTETPSLQETTEALKPDPTEPITTYLETTSERITTPLSKITDPPQQPDHSKKHEQTEKTGSSDNSKLWLTVTLGVVGTLFLCFVAFGVYKWYRSSHNSNAVTRVNSDEREKIEICVEPSTSSAEPSPLVKRSQSEQDKSDTEINGIQPPWQETERLVTDFDRRPTAAGNQRGSCLHVLENEY